MRVAELLPFVLSAAQKAPRPEDVKAGWTAFAIFLILCAVVVFLGFSLFKQLKRVETNRAAGVFDAPAEGSEDSVRERS